MGLYKDGVTSGGSSGHFQELHAFVQLWIQTLHLPSLSDSFINKKIEKQNEDEFYRAYVFFCTFSVDGAITILILNCLILYCALKI